MLGYRITFLVAQYTDIRIRQKLPGQAQVALADTAKTDDENSANQYRIFFMNGVHAIGSIPNFLHFQHLHGSNHPAYRHPAMVHALDTPRCV